MKKFAKSLSLLAVFALASTVWAAPLDAFKDLEGKLDIAGGTAHIPVMTQAAQIGNTGRPLKPAEIEKYGLVSFPFAIDGVALAVHPSNPVKALTKEQAVAIYTGKITDWKELGGEPGAIDVYGREDGSGTRETFQGKVMGKVEQMPSVNTVNSNGAMKTAIAQDPRAIGYVGIGHLDASVAGVAIDGHVPSQENAAKGEYPVVRDLFMNTKGEPTGLTAAFVDYVFSEPGAKIIEKSGYIPLPKPVKK